MLKVSNNIAKCVVTYALEWRAFVSWCPLTFLPDTLLLFEIVNLK
jgi:hypothetical protein